MISSWDGIGVECLGAVDGLMDAVVDVAVAVDLDHLDLVDERTAVDLVSSGDAVVVDDE